MDYFRVNRTDWYGLSLRYSGPLVSNIIRQTIDEFKGDQVRMLAALFNSRALQSEHFFSMQPDIQQL